MKIELTHDILAKKVGEKVSVEDKRIRRVEKFIHDKYEASVGLDKTLSKEDLDYIQPYLKRIYLSTEETGFIEKSQLAVKKKRQRLILLTVLFTVGVAILSGLSYYLAERTKVEDKTHSNRERAFTKKRGFK